MAVEAEEAGMDAFMEKPFRLEELTAVYVKLLERDNRTQRDGSAPPGVNTSLGIAVRSHRSIRNITPNAKIFIDSDEFDNITATQIDGETSLLEQDGTPPTTAMSVSERKVAETSQKVTTDHAQLLTGSGIDNGTISGLKHSSAKVHAEN